MPLLLAVGLALTFTSCKKEKETIDDSISAEDLSNANASFNSTTDDAANVIGAYPALSGKTDGAMQSCGFTVDTTNKNQGILVINYNGSSCGDISITGSLKLTLQGYPDVRWKDAGAVLKLDYDNVRVTNNRTSGYFTLNGTHTLTNVTGGLAWKILQTEQGTVIHRHQANGFTLTFADGSIRTWSVNRLRTFNNNGSVYTVTVSSDHTEGGVDNADVWGSNRNGLSFTNSIPEDITVTSANMQCGGLWYNRPAAGKYKHEVGNRSVEVQFGVNASGDVVAAGTCPFGYKITYTRNNRSATKVVSYWF